MENWKLRRAKPSDALQILDLVRQLAAYEREPDAVEVTEEELIRDGFGDKPVFECLVAENEGGKLLGIAIFFIRYSTWRGPSLYLEDLFVDPESRKLGVGQAFFRELAKIALDRGYRQMNWQVLDWNELAINFYKKIGSDLDGEWINGTLSESAMKKLVNSGI